MEINHKARPYGRLWLWHEGRGLSISGRSWGCGRRHLGFGLLRGLGMGLGSGRGRGRSGYRGGGSGLHLALLNGVRCWHQSTLRGDIFCHDSIGVICRKGEGWGSGKRQEGGVNEVAGCNKGFTGLNCTILVKLLNLCPEWEEGSGNSGKMEGWGGESIVRVKAAENDSNITLTDCNSMG
jgi:hypothetical protein